jgi:hypothetical protein
MNRVPVESANIASIGFDKETSTLEIEFLDGAVYQYFDIEERLFTGLVASDAKGAYFAKNIKGIFRYSRV